MSIDAPPTEPTMLSDVLDELNRSGLLTIKQLEHMLYLGRRSGYQYLDGTDMRFGQFRTVFHASKNPDVQRQLLGVLLDGTGWVCRHLPVDKDINGDGRINLTDALDAALEANRELSQVLVTLQEENKRGMRRTSSDRAAKINKLIGDHLQHLLAVQAIVCDLAADQPQRTQRTQG